MNEQLKSQEIDLKQVLKPILKQAEWLGKGLSSYGSALKKLRWWVIGFVLTIAILSVSLRSFIPRYYSTEAMYVSHTLDANLCSSLLGSLSEFAGDGKNTAILSKGLGISMEAAQSIYKMKAEALTDTGFMRKYDSFPSVFRVVLIVTDNKHIQSIQSGIQQYLENNDYAAKRKKARIRTLELQNNSYESKLKSLDSLREIVNNSIQPRSTGNGIILGEPIDPINVYKAQDSFYKDLLRNQERIYLSDNIEVIQPFIEPVYFNYPDTTRLILWIILAALLVAVVFFPVARIGMRMR